MRKHEGMRTVCSDEHQLKSKSKHDWIFGGMNSTTLFGWHVCRTKLARNVFSRHEFSHEKCSEMFPDTFEPLKLPPNFSQNFPPQNQKRIHRRASAGAPGENNDLCGNGISFVGKISRKAALVVADCSPLSMMCVCVRARVSSMDFWGAPRLAEDMHES